MEGLIRFEFERDCPSCHSKTSRQRFSARGEGSAFHPASFSARKSPEPVHPSYVECNDCALLFATPALRPETLKYENTAKVDAEEAPLAARSYYDAVSPRLRGGRALDFGCGQGDFLALLDDRFTTRLGIDPGHKRSQEPFGSFDLVTGFQVLEHVVDPRKVLEWMFEWLTPGGTLFLVDHDERSWSHRLLGKRSPLLDLQHFQLFSPRTLTRLLREVGFIEIETFSFRNTYPAKYWARLSPLPASAKHWVKRSRWGNQLWSFSLGNFGTFATRK